MIQFPKNIKRPLHSIKIGVIGAGGTGSHVVKKLAVTDSALKQLNHPGIEAHLIDFDRVEAHNVGRQEFASCDVGRLKCDVLIERINMYFGLDWSGICSKVDKQTNLTDFDIIITCVDNVLARKDVCESLKSVNDVVWVDYGNGKDRGQVIMGMKTNSKWELDHVFDFFPDMQHSEDTNELPSCSMFESLHKQDLFINTILADFGVDIIYKLLRYSHIEFQGCFVNLSNYSVSAIPIDKERFAKNTELNKVA